MGCLRRHFGQPGAWHRSCHCCSVAMCDSLRPHGLQHSRLPCPSLSPGVFPNSGSLSWLYYPTISFSVTLFSFCLQSFPASGSFSVSQLFAISGQTIGASASASVLPMNIQDWFPLGWTSWISLQSKELSSLLQHCNSKASILSSWMCISQRWQKFLLNSF